jgi:hypothetical protein
MAKQCISHVDASDVPEGVTPGLNNTGCGLAARYEDTFKTGQETIEITWNS